MQKRAAKPFAPRPSPGPAEGGPRSDIQKIMPSTWTLNSVKALEKTSLS